MPSNINNKNLPSSKSNIPQDTIYSSKTKGDTSNAQIGAIKDTKAYLDNLDNRLKLKHKPISERKFKVINPENKLKALIISKDLKPILHNLKFNLQKGKPHEGELLERLRTNVDKLNDLLEIEDRASLEFTYNNILTLYEIEDIEALIADIKYFENNLRTIIKDNERPQLEKLCKLDRRIHLFSAGIESVKEKKTDEQRYEEKFTEFMEKSLSLQPHIENTGKFLGRGAYGSVYQGVFYDPETGNPTPVAIKELDIRKIKYEKFKQEVIQSIKVREKSPNLCVDTIAAYEDKGAYKIIMELGRCNLTKAVDLLSIEDLPVNYLVDLFLLKSQLIKRFLKDGIFMSDFHNENILLTDTNEAKICDLGCFRYSKNTPANAIKYFRSLKFHITDRLTPYNLEIEDSDSEIEDSDFKLEEYELRLQDDDIKEYSFLHKKFTTEELEGILHKYFLKDLDKLNLNFGVIYDSDVNIREKFIENFMNKRTIYDIICYIKPPEVLETFVQYKCFVNGYINFVNDYLKGDGTLIKDALKILNEKEAKN